ncbi:MAG TPA: SPW repeat protein [Candidatus Bathyarchaeia archaeon]|nr:SPW repeat protein [Candidatus Bathyarchaeia archaeon]
MDNNQQVRTAGWINVILGIWLIASPFLLGFTGTALSRNNVIFGIIIAVLSLFEVSAPEESAWAGWLNALFGIWILISPFVLGFTGMGALWNGIIAGIIVAVLAIWGATSSSSTSEHPRAV